MKNKWKSYLSNNYFLTIAISLLLVSNVFAFQNGTYKLHQAGGYLDIDGNTGKVIYEGDKRYSGTNWLFVHQGDGVYKIKNKGESRFKNWYLDIDGKTCITMLTNDPRYSGTNWKVEELGGGLIKLKNRANVSKCTGYLKHARTGDSTWSVE